MITRMLRLATTALLLLGPLAARATPAAAESVEHHSGTVMAVDPGARTLVVKELVQEGRPRQLVVKVPSGAAVIISNRIPDEQVTRFDTVFIDKSIDLGEVRPGDFVVVEGAARGDTAAAGKITVTLRP